MPKKKRLKLSARRQGVKKGMKMLRGVPKTQVLGRPYSVLCSRFVMDFYENVQKPWVFEEIDFIGANEMSINARPLTGAGTMFYPINSQSYSSTINQSYAHYKSHLPAPLVVQRPAPLNTPSPATAQVAPRSEPTSDATRRVVRLPKKLPETIQICQKIVNVIHICIVIYIYIHMYI